MVNRIITTELDRNLLNERLLQNELINIEESWEHASKYKREVVLTVFNIDTTLLKLCERNIVIFSQPLVKACKLTIEDHINIYKPYIDKFGAANILIKLHPQDNFDYKKYYPEIETLITKAPQQLLYLLGMKFDTAITCCSSAVSSVNDDCNIIWIGAEIDERIVKTYGHVKQPKNKR